MTQIEIMKIAIYQTTDIASTLYLEGIVLFIIVYYYIVEKKDKLLFYNNYLQSEMLKG